MSKDSKLIANKIKRESSVILNAVRIKFTDQRLLSEIIVRKNKIN